MTRTRRTWIALVVGLAAMSAGTAGQERRAQARAALGDITCLAGDWSGRAGTTELEERWTKPAGGAMLAVSRTIKDTRMVAFEFLRIVERDGASSISRNRADVRRPSSR